MRARTVRRALGLLLFGAAATVVVAWVCAVLVDETTGTTDVVVQKSSIFGIDWRYAILRKPGACRVIAVAQNEDSVPLRRRPAIPMRPPADVPVWNEGWPYATRAAVPGLPQHEYPRIADARGWPFVSMWSEHFMHLDEDNEFNVDAYRGVLVSLRPERVDVRVVPIGVYWPGFLGSTLFYAAAATAVWGLWRGFGAVRGWRRRRRGVCPKCAYVLGEATVCAECGWTRPRRPASADPSCPT